jgi:plastocyanin
VYHRQVHAPEEAAMPCRRLLASVPAVAVLVMALAVAAPARAGGGCHLPASEGRGGTLTLTELCFSPTVLRVAPSTRLTIVNRDQFTHPLGRPGTDWWWEAAPGARTSVRLDAAGTYPFFCWQHPGMVGVVVVGDGRGAGGRVATVAEAAPAAPVAAASPPARSGGIGWWPLAVAAALLAGAAGGRRLAARRAG